MAFEKEEQEAQSALRESGKNNKMKDNLDLLLQKLDTAQAEQDLEYDRQRQREKANALRMAVSRPMFSFGVNEGRVAMNPVQQVPYNPQADEAERSVISNRLRDKANLLRSLAGGANTVSPEEFAQRETLKHIHNMQEINARGENQRFTSRDKEKENYVNKTMDRLNNLYKTNTKKYLDEMKQYNKSYFNQFTMDKPDEIPSPDQRDLQNYALDLWDEYKHGKKTKSKTDISDEDLDKELFGE